MHITIFYDEWLKEVRSFREIENIWYPFKKIRNGFHHGEFVLAAKHSQSDVKVN